MEEVKASHSATIAVHLARSNELHKKGTLLMTGVFLDNPDQPVSTMGIFASRDAAEEYAKSDPFRFERAGHEVVHPRVGQ